MNKGFWIIIGIIVAIFGGILLFRGDSEQQATNAQPTSHIKGGNEKGVELVEYADYQCPFCSQFYPVVKEVVANYENDISFQFRNLPLTQIHKHSFAAARAAEAAGLQDKFWEMNELILQNQSSWSNSGDAVPIFEQYASQLGLDMEKYRNDFSSAAVNDMINADIAEFRKTGFSTATPTFILDGQKIEPRTFEELSKLIDEAIAKKNPQE